MIRLKTAMPIVYLTLSGLFASAQTGQITSFVCDETGKVIEAAIVAIPKLDLGTTTGFDKTASLSLRYIMKTGHGGEMNWNKSDRKFMEFNEYDGDPNSPGYNADYVLLSGYTIYNQKYAKGFRVPRFDNATDKRQWIDAVRQANPCAALADNMSGSYRYIWFKDNTIASDNGKDPFITQMPGFFIRDLWTLNPKTSLLLGYRFDYDITRSSSGDHENPVHSPRIALKYTPDNKNTFRASPSAGYRVVNIFSEDHRALSDQYEAKFGEALKPEKSPSGTVDYEGWAATEGIGLTYGISAYYTHFFNKIYPVRNDINRTLTYFNVDGDEHARNIGVSLDIALNFRFPFRLTAGVSYTQAELFEFERDDNGDKVSDKIVKSPFEFSPKWSGVFTAAYDFIPQLAWDGTGEWRGPMLLPYQVNNFVNIYGKDEKGFFGYPLWLYFDKDYRLVLRFYGLMPPKNILKALDKI